MQSRAIFVNVLVWGLFFAVPTCVLADADSDYKACSDAQAADKAKCSTDQANNDAGYLNTQKTTQANDATAKQTTLNNNATDFGIAKNACDETLWGYIGNPKIMGDQGSCKRDQINQDLAATAANATDIYNCNANNTKQADIDKCVCLANSLFNFKKAQDAAACTKCQADAQSQYGACTATAAAIKAQADSLATVTCDLADATAAAQYAKDTTMENNYKKPLCDYHADTKATACNNAADCKWWNFPPGNDTVRCCEDDAGTKQRNAYDAAYTAWVGTVGPADSQHQYDLLMADANQSHDDGVAKATWQKTKDDAATKKNLADGLAYNIEQQSFSTDDNQYWKDVEDCACKFPTDPAQESTCCDAAATAANKADDAASVAYYLVAAEPPQNPVGSAYTAWFATAGDGQQADTTYNGTVQKDQSTHDGRVKSVNTTYNGTKNTADVILNNADNAADKQLQHDLDVCHVEPPKSS